MSWPIAEQSRRHVATPSVVRRRTPRIMWIVVAAAFLCGAAVSAAAFSIGWKHQAQKNTKAEAALVAATASVHSLRMQLATAGSSLAASHAQVARLRASRKALDGSLATLRRQLVAVRQSLSSTSAAAAPLSADLDRLTNELRALTSYVTQTPSGQLDAGYLQAQVGYVSKTASGLSAALAALAAPKN
jgi:septal ring factor EnvC (AmiA/AmiB activator)